MSRLKASLLCFAHALMPALPRKRLIPFVALAVTACLASGQAVAEPYPGNPRDDPAVRIVSWILLVGFSLAAGLLPALYRCRSDLRAFPIAANTLAFGLAVGLVCYLSPVFDVLTELVSLVLHLVL
jgi:hypothetical protein